MDWDAWARKAEAALDVAGRGDWRGLFAPGATFSDPATTVPTTDLQLISRDTTKVFPDWRQTITRIRGDQDWAVFEWIGYATYSPGADAPGHGAKVEMHGATIVEVNDDGLVTSWRDYLDRKEPESQIRAAARAKQ
ncbi:MAG: nuclear transport factor 2 family protein [Acidimicrobiales bacterium]